MVRIAMTKRAKAWGAWSVLASGMLSTWTAFAEPAGALPPWPSREDVPVPAWARSVSPTKLDAPLFVDAGKQERRRGSLVLGARLPLYGTKVADGCSGRWFNVGPLAWVCSDHAEYAREEPTYPPLGLGNWFDEWSKYSSKQSILPPVEPFSKTDDGLPYRYYFVGPEGAYGYASLADAQDDVPELELQRGFAIVVVEQKSAFGETWGRTKTGRWFRMRELIAARPSLFHGELVDAQGQANGELNLAWVVVDKARVFDSEKATKSVATKPRFERVTIYEEKPAKSGNIVRISSDQEPPRFMRAKDLARPKKMAPPDEAGGASISPTERWIDVDLAQQTLTAYQGTTPVFASLVSTGRGPNDSDTGTRPGVHRIWVKIFTTKMDNLEKEDLEQHYAIEDVPWVQFFDKGIALHGAFWHRDFGHVHSHGCVNLSPLDARWLFAFTSPHLPRGWSAVYPTILEPSTLVRVR